MATVEGEVEHAVPRAGRRRFLRPRVVGTVGLALAAGLLGVMLVTPKPSLQRSATLACTDVAAASGLDFKGEYGQVFPTNDTMGNLMQRNMGNGAAVGDYNGDGYLDVFLLGQAGHASRLFRNDPGAFGTRVFVDATAQAGLSGITSNARVAQFVDLSGSGRPDLVVASDFMTGGPAGPSQIFRNNGDSTFTDVTSGSGFDPSGYIVGGMTFADYDGSGRQSIYLTYWTEELGGDPARTNIIQGTWPGHNRLYRNLGNYHFEDVTRSSGIGEYHADTFTAIFADFTGDGRPDIYQADDHRPDKFFVNQADGTFKDQSHAAGLTRKGNSMGVATAVGPSGALNLYVTNITDPGRRFGTNQGNTYFMSSQDATGIHFTNDATSRGIADTAWGWGTAFVDLDGDGALDLYTAQGMREFVGNGSVHIENATSFLFMNDGTGQNFAPTTAPGCEVPGDQRALVVLDFNRDGAPDLLMTQVNGSPILLENIIANKNWLTVAPDGPGDAGINALVSVTVGGRTTSQIVLAGGSYLAGPPREAYFGLGTAAKADTVVVQWADGRTTELKDVPAGQLLWVSAP